MKLIWMTDIHLNFLENIDREAFYQNIINEDCDAVLISGDIAEADCLQEILHEFAEYIKKPIYFVLGNHDYYGGNVKEVRDAMRMLRRENKNLLWLPHAGLQMISDDTILLGQDGWADGRYGDYENSSVVMNDSVMIEDLYDANEQGRDQLLKKMQALADADAEGMKALLRDAIGKNPKKIIVLTHVPPFKEACQYRGEPTKDDFLPFYSSKAMGDVLLHFAKLNPHIEFQVLCGHTHYAAQCVPLNNLHVEAGMSKYGKPGGQKIIEVKQYQHGSKPK